MRPVTQLTEFLDLQAILPHVTTMLKQPDEKDFHDWRHIPVQRAHALMVQLREILNEYPDLPVRLSDHEKYSPNACINKSLSNYLYTVDDRMLPFLRHALVNAALGPYGMEQREDLLSTANMLYPLDILILNYLVSRCRDNKAFEAACRVNTDICDALSMEAVNGIFPEFTAESRQRAVDRLLQYRLIHNHDSRPVDPAVSFTRFFSPYDTLVPLVLAEPLLHFLADPRKTWLSAERALTAQTQPVRQLQA